jgi:DNA modification methylase
MKRIEKLYKLKKHSGNPRIIKDVKFKKLVESLKEFPEMMEQRPLIVNSNLEVLGGNMRLSAARESGLKEIWIDEVDWSEDKQKEFMIKDNSGYGEWDWDILANEWDVDKLNDWGLDLPPMFDDPKEAIEDNYTEPDNLQVDVVLGDLIEIGEHRLLCGDSTDSDQVAKLMNGDKPFLMITDPPYGVEYNPKWRDEAERSNGKKIGASALGQVQNDNNADWTDIWSLSPSKIAYVFHADKFSNVVQDSLERCDFVISNQIIWAKNNFAISRGNYHWKHEPCWYACKKGSTRQWIGDHSQTTLWEIDKPLKSETGHGTQKPLECMLKPIKNHKGDVYDPFLGSGTTMVAAHQLKRKCYGMELDPKYCQVIIDRMQKLDSDLQIKINGKIYEKTEHAL